MKNGSASAILLGAGAILVLGSVIAPRVITGRGEWTDDLAVKLQQASHNYHAALHALAHTHSAEDAHETKLDAVRRDYDHYSSLLVAAQTRGQRTSQILRWSGILGCVAGLLVYVVNMVISARQ